ncbi:transposase [Palleronia caenipelagi]|uniref:Transposase n=1 Tax=Palleronia caenipelagi TaxID=2489174 RepID=A0A547PHL1_9RHOB|nr:transposase [Palleronia caenipelagi]
MSLSPDSGVLYPWPWEKDEIRRHRRKHTDEFNAAAVDRLYEPGATEGTVAKELGITGTQLKT